MRTKEARAAANGAASGRWPIFDRSPTAGWRVVGAYGLVAAATQMLWLTYAAITTDTARRYGVSVGAVGWLAEIFPLLYVALAIPAGALLDRWFRPGLALGGAPPHRSVPGDGRHGPVRGPAGAADGLAAGAPGQLARRSGGDAGGSRRPGSARGG